MASTSSSTPTGDAISQFSVSTLALLHGIPKEIILRVSQRFLTLFANDDVPDISMYKEGFESVEGIEAIVEFWRYAIYYQKSSESLEILMNDVELPCDKIDLMLPLWDKMKEGVLERAGKRTATGIPRVCNTKWTVEMKVEGDTSTQKEPRLRFCFSTDQGPRTVRLNRSEAEHLYAQMMQAQEQLDIVLANDEKTDKD